MQAEVHAPMEPEVQTEAHKPNGPFDQVRHPPTPEDPVEQETEVPEPLQVPVDTPQLKPMVPEQPLPQVLPMPRPMPLPDAIPKVPDQPIPFQGLINPRPSDIRLLGTLPGYDDNIDDRIQPEVSIRQPDRTMYRKSMKLFDEIQDEMIFRKHLPRQLEINKFLESLKRNVIHDYDIPVSIKELSAEYEKSQFFMDIYKYITKGHIPSSIKGQALRKLKTQCEDYLVIDDILFRTKIPKDRNLEPSLLLVIPESYVPTILYQYHDSLLAGNQGVTRMYCTLKEKFYANNLFNSIRKYVQSCHTCHTRSTKEPGYKAYHTRIPFDFRPMSRISADIKWMPLSNQGFN